jgi:hypothetical protein
VPSLRRPQCCLMHSASIRSSSPKFRPIFGRSLMRKVVKFE